MVKKKGHSKRSTLKDKYKIQHRVIETQRKRRKQSKKDLLSGKSKIHNKNKKDPGIPNSWPFKQELLQEIAISQDRLKLQKQQQQKKKSSLNVIPNTQEHLNDDNDNSITTTTITTPRRTMDEYMKQTQSDHMKYQHKLQDKEENNDNENNIKSKKKVMTDPSLNGQQSRRAYLRDFKQVIDQSDVILHVLDVRDPIHTRMTSIHEDYILSFPNKKMIFILNKIDLVPKSIVYQWLLYLRKSHPTIAIKASSGYTGGSHTMKHTTTTEGGGSVENSSTSVGMDGLLQLLKNYTRNDHTNIKKKSSIVVGIVGYPNTGKSSIINALKRCRTVGVSPKPGYTTSLQEIVLDSTIRLIDSPGIVFHNDTNIMLGNCMNIETLSDPIQPILLLLQRANHHSLLVTYNIPTFTPHTNVDMFLSLVAKSHGRITKGGIPDKNSIARCILRDWNIGKIPYYTIPPTASSDDHTNNSTTTSSSSSIGGGSSNATIVTEFSPAFDCYAQIDKDVLDSLPQQHDIDEMDCIQLDTTTTATNNISSIPNSTIGNDNHGTTTNHMTSINWDDLDNEENDDDDDEEMDDHQEMEEDDDDDDDSEEEEDDEE